MTTLFPLSKLPQSIQDNHNQYVGTGFVTLVKYVEAADFYRFAIALFRDMDTMLELGWKVIDATK